LLPDCRFKFVARTFILPVMRWLFMAAVILPLLSVHTRAGQILFSENFAHGVPRWENVAFWKRQTDYQVQHDGTNYFLAGVADKTCSALSVKLDIAPPEHLILRWRWKIGGVNTNASEKDLSKFDHAARVFVAFDTLIGPPRTLNYLWANVEPAGRVLEHPKSGRAELFMVESGNSKAGKWIAEERDVTADWKRAFPDKPMPKIVGLGVMTDSDSLGEKLAGDYTDIELIAK